MCIIQMQYKVMQVKQNQILPKHNSKTESKTFQKIVGKMAMCD